MTNYRKWTEPEIEYLRANYASMTATAMAQVLGRQIGSVSQKVEHLGLRKPPKDHTKPRLLQAIMEDTSPLGLSCVELCERLGFTVRSQVTWALMALMVEHPVYRIGGTVNRHSRYVYGEERRDQCHPALVEWMKQRRKDLLRAKHARAREKYRAGPKYSVIKQKPRKPPKERPPAKQRPPSLTFRLGEWLAADQSPIGARLSDAAEALGSSRRAMERSVAELRHQGKAYVIGVVPFKRYVSTPERLAEIAEAYAAWLAVERLSLGKRSREPKPRKKQKAGADMVVKRGSAVDASVQLKSKPSRAAWSEQEAIVPRGVRVVVCPPCPPDRRWYVEPSSVPVVPVQQWGKV